MTKLSRILFKGAMLGAMTISMSSCSVVAAEYEAGTPVKVGLICLHADASTYDKNFIDAMNQAVQELGAEKVDGNAIIKTNIAESNACFNAAKDLVKQGCNVIFADSFGHEPFMIKAAKKWPSVTFCHATGTKAKTEGVENFHNAFASIYEGRYLAGYAAGLELQRMVAANQLSANNLDSNGNIKLGYVGAFPYAEVVSGYTSWFLGVREVVPNVVMDVTFTGSWYDYNAEEAGATALIDRGAALVSQHADSMGAPNACDSANVPNVTYNNPTDKNTFVAYSKIDWAPYYKAVINAMYSGTAIAGERNNNWTGSLASGSVIADCKNTTDKAALLAVKAELAAGTRQVFDCSKFTVTVINTDTVKKNVNATVDNDGHLTAYQADVDDMGDYQGDTNVITTAGGITYFNESFYRSAPYFDVQIDGITQLNA